MQTLQNESASMGSLLTARQVQDVLHIDRSTVYRMADDGRLPAIRVGKQWRFPREQILALVSKYAGLAEGVPEAAAGTPTAPAPIDAAVATAAAEVAADLLGVMMVVTDMEGNPLTPIANPCEWFVEHGDDPQVMATCTAEWRSLADNHNFEPEFRVGQHGFECARVFIRSGRQLAGMVLAGGVSAPGETDPDLHNLNTHERARVLRALPKIAAAIALQAPVPAGASPEVSQ